MHRRVRNIQRLMKNKSNLPVALKIASYTEALDNIYVNPTNSPDGIEYKTIRQFIWFFWKESIIDKAVKQISKDINNALYYDKESVFIPYVLANNFYRKGFYMYMDLGYKIDYNNRVEKVQKIMNKINE